MLPCDVERHTQADSASRLRLSYNRRAEVTETLARYVEARVGRLLKCLVADYLKDEFGQWWLLQVRTGGVKRWHARRV